MKPVTGVGLFRSLKSSLTVALLMVFSATQVNLAWALEVRPEDYPYEYKDPIIATLSGALGHSADQALGLKVRINSITLKPERNRVPFLENRAQLAYRFYPQRDRSAPLIFVVAGFGGNAVEGSTMFTAEKLALSGYQVLTVPSPFFWHFILAAGSTALPGLTDEDSEDLYHVMKAELADVRARYGIRPRSIGAVGFSMGALQLMYVSQIDKRETAAGSGIGFRKVVAVNPPVDVAHDAVLFDELLVTGLSTLSPAAMESLKQRVMRFAVQVMERNPHQAGYFSNLEKRFPLTPQEAKFMIGVSFHDTLTNAIYVSQLIQDLGILQEKPTRYGKNHRLAESGGFLFQQYIGQFVMPQWAHRRGVATATLEDLKSHANFAPIAEAIAGDERVHLMHNLDDPLVTADHLDLLKRTFGDRAIFYPFGGHVGNYWHPRNVEDLRASFKSL